MEYKNIIVSTKEYVTTIVLNRPPMNSVNLGIREELFHAVTELNNSKETRAVIITGAGEKGFCAGMDVSDVANITKGPNGNEIMNAISRSTKPFIAAINGHALGGGCEMALACHFRFMTDHPKAFIGLPEVNLGITPGWGGIQRLPRVLGKSKALDIILFSKRMAPADALAIGLIDKVIPAVDLMKEVTAFAAALAKRPPLAVAAVLDGMSVGMDKGFDEGLRLDQEWSNKLAASKDAVEGITAFLQKREPVFTGE
ncbi:MAG TPA: enoyl-CoA hydratase/isomerase family protein [Smithellaceae bacterium]|nr:enoyl-CoA hydratase/isomerase family protein [Smithellaceae bacterium]HRY38293.1 enoyl-CoA hydratase/isomerase family protein [Smithellaceae bacterium]